MAENRELNLSNRFLHLVSTRNSAEGCNMLRLAKAVVQQCYAGTLSDEQSEADPPLAGE